MLLSPWAEESTQGFFVGKEIAEMPVSGMDVIMAYLSSVDYYEKFQDLSSEKLYRGISARILKNQKLISHKAQKEETANGITGIKHSGGA